MGRSETVTEALYEAGFGSSSRLYERVDAQLGMTPAEYKAEGRGVEFSYVILSTPPGQILIAGTGCERRWRGNIRRHHTPRRFVDCGGKEN